jgi:hypothetical protein
LNGSEIFHKEAITTVGGHRSTASPKLKNASEEIWIQCDHVHPDLCLLLGSFANNIRNIIDL